MSLPAVRTDVLDSEYGPRFAALTSALGDCKKIDADALKLIREISAKYPIMDDDHENTDSSNISANTPRDKENSKDKSNSRKSTTRQTSSSSSSSSSGSAAAAAASSSLSSARGNKK